MTRTRKRPNRRARRKNKRKQSQQTGQYDPKVIELHARYDLADFNDEINEQFARARHESGNTGLNVSDRRLMIDRSRHEIFQANAWLKGTVRSATVSVVGRGPEVEVKREGREEDAHNIEKEFNRWLTRRKVGRKFRCMNNAKQSDGSGLAIVVDNWKNPIKGINLDFQPFDDDHVKLPHDRLHLDRTELLLDGKEYDPVTGEPSRYWVTPKHPAEHPESRPEPVEAKYILDVWDWLRPSQGRGAPEYATVVKNGPLQRSFRRATLDAATTAAKHTAVMQTSIDTFENGDPALRDVADWVTIPTQYGMLTGLPAGWSMSQFKAEHPNTTHTEFLRSLAAENGRAGNQPAFISLGDGLGLNMSSMSGLKEEWELEVSVQRQEWETEALDKLFVLWLKQAALLGLIPKDMQSIDDFDHQWRWSKRRHQDTNREYSGRAKSVEFGLRSRASWQMEDNRNPDAEDLAAAEGYGVPLEVFRQAVFLKTYGDAARTALGLPTANQAIQPGATDESQSDDSSESSSPIVEELEDRIAMLEEAIARR